MDIWEGNAQSWIEAIRCNHIRKNFVTTQGAIDAVMAEPCKTILDMGCGEGVIARALIQKGYDVFGIDACAQLIKKAQEYIGEYAVISYEEFMAHPKAVEKKFDVVLFNFSIFAEDIVPLLKASKSKLNNNGRIIIQIGHPCSGINNIYEDKWRMVDFNSICNLVPVPFYFRTFGTWLKVFADAGLVASGCYEPINPETQKPLSLIWSCDVDNYGGK